MTNRAISGKTFEDVLSVWKAIKINTINDYHDLLLKFNVLLLAYVFETFREESINSFELNPAHYLFTVYFL